MILDQTIGVHHAQAEVFGFGWAWTWLSGEGVAGATLVGVWANVIEAKTGSLIHAYTGRLLEAKTGTTIEARNV